MKENLKQKVSSSLILLLGAQSFAWAPLSYGQTVAALGNRQAVPTMTLSFDIPDGGRIDHFNYAGKDKRADALYLLRNTMVEELLHTRHNLKLLLGSEDDLRRTSNGKMSAFGVPANVKHLYLNSQMGTIVPDPDPSANMSTDPSQEETAPDFDIAPEITREIHWLSTSETKYDRGLRLHVIEKLAAAAAEVVRIDQHIKYLEKDYLANREMAQEYCDEQLGGMPKAIAYGTYSMMGAAAGGPITSPYLAICGNTTSGDSLRAAWIAKHAQISIDAFRSVREERLARFNLLKLDTGEGVPLYKVLYRILEKQGFPSMDYVQKPADAHLPRGEAAMAVPTEFEDLIGRGLKRMVDPLYRPYIVDALYREGNGKVDSALLIALRGNTDLLANITSQIKYSCNAQYWECDSPLLEAAKYDDLWETATAKYAYLADLVDMKKVRGDMNKYWNSRKENERHLRFWGTVGGIGVGVVATVMTFGGAAWLAGATGVAVTGVNYTVGGLALAASIFEVTATYNLYNQSSALSRMETGLNAGTKSRGTSTGMAQARELSHDDWVMLVASIVGLGLSFTHVARTYANVRAAKNVAGQTVIQLAEEDAARIRSAAADIQATASELTVMGSTLLGNVRRLLGTDVKVVNLADVVENMGRELNRSGSEIMTALRADPTLSKWVNGLGPAGEINTKNAARLGRIVDTMERTSDKFYNAGKAILTAIEKALGQSFSELQVVRLTEAVEELATRFKTTPKEIYTRIDRWELGHIINGLAARREFASRIMIASRLLEQMVENPKAVVPSSFWRGMLDQQTNGFILNVLSDGAARWEEMKEGHMLGFFKDMGRNLMVETVLAFSVRSGNVSAAADSLSELGKVKVIGKPRYTGKDLVRDSLDLGKSMVSNAALGVVINGTFETVHQLVEDDDSSWKEKSRHIINSAKWNALSLGLSSTWRSRLCTAIQARIYNTMLSKPDRWLLVQGMWTANNLFGGYTYVSWGQKLKWIDQEGKEVPEGREDLDGSVAGLRIGDLTGSYIKVAGGQAGDDELAGYLERERGAPLLNGTSP